MDSAAFATWKMDLISLSHLFFVIAFIGVGALTSFFIFWGGIKFIVARGDEEKIKKAVDTIRNAIIGLIIVLLSVPVIGIVARIFGFDGIVVSYPYIVETVNGWIAAMNDVSQ